MSSQPRDLLAERDVLGIVSEGVRRRHAFLRQRAIIPPPIVVKKTWPSRHFKGDPQSEQMVRARAVVGVIAKAFGLEPYQVMEGAHIRRFGPARKIAVVILRDVLGFGHIRAAGVLDLSLDGCRYLRQEGERLLRTDAEVARRHALALEKIRERWPEYRRPA